MEVTTALLCDYAQVRDGLLFIMSGAVTRLNRSELPAPLGVFLALTFSMNLEEIGRLHEVRVVVSDDDGRLAEARGGMQAQARVEIGEELLVPVALDLRPVALRRYGEVRFEISADDGPVHCISAWCQPQPSAEGEPSPER
jgi:hypothetical protein